MMKKILLHISALSIIFTAAMTMLIPAGASAAVPAGCGKGFLGFPHWYEYLVLDADCGVVGPCANKDDASVAIPDEQCAGKMQDGTARISVAATTTRVILAIIDILLRVGGMVAFAFIVYAGFQFVLSTGDTNKEVAARNTIINAAIGMVITIFAVAIVTYVGRTISQ